MKIDIITLFPDMFTEIFNHSIIKRAIDAKKAAIQIINLRDFANNKHKKVDDYQFGGGKGMVLSPQPIYDAVKKLKKANSKVILMSPQGEVFHQKKAYQLAQEKHLIIICGHYEGVDERVLDIVDLEISIGDYILTGGELPAMVLTDSIIRLVDDVIAFESQQQESFNDNLLDYPVYTRPANFRGRKVPEILLSGHHQEIEKWRLKERKRKTALRRPDLLERGDDNEK